MPVCMDAVSALTFANQSTLCYYLSCSDCIFVLSATQLPQMIHVSRHDCREWWKKTEMQGWAFQLASQGQFKSLLSFPLSQSVATAWLKIKSTTILNFSPCHFSISNSRSTQLTKQAWIHDPSAVTIANKDKTEQRNATFILSKVKEWKLSCMETRKKSWLVKCLEIVWCRGGDRCVCVCVFSPHPSFSTSFFHLSFLRSAPPQPDRPNTLPKEKQDGPLLMTSHRRLLGGDGVMACVCMRLCSCMIL